ncbi:MAG: response regulator [Candidatus Eisenbacteria sp.]|nr:response regulator [Candidatus Eisenbacteria bacterium]
MEKKTIRGSSPILSERREQESILVAEQDVRVIELLQITLTGRGYAVRSAFDGEAAHEEILRHKPDLAVIGVRLPRKSGFQVLEAIRADERTARLPVILIAGSPSNEARIQGLRLGADDYLVKPFSPRELLIKIRTILDRLSDLRLLRQQNRALEEEARQHRDEQRQFHHEMDVYLQRIGAVLQHVDAASRRGDLSKVLGQLAQAVVRDLRLVRACVLMQTEPGESLVPRAWRGLDDQAVRRLRLKAEGFVCGTVAREGRTMMSDEFASYPSAEAEVRLLSAAGLTHITPARREDGGLVAILAGGEREDGEPLDRLDVHLLNVLARAAVMAIDHATAFAGARHSFVETTAQLVATVEERYPELAGHSARVLGLTARLAAQCGLSEEESRLAAFVARLHDLGALEQYDQLFSEQRVFSEEERLALRRQAATGVRRMLAAAHLPEVAEGVYHLNERWDGSGLPEGLAGESLPQASRLVAITNAYDALTHARPHRPAYDVGEALLILRERAGSQFDPELVRVFVEMISETEGIEPVQSLTMPTMRGPESRSK